MGYILRFINQLNIKSIFIMLILFTLTIQDIKFGIYGFSLGRRGDIFFIEIIIIIFLIYSTILFLTKNKTIHYINIFYLYIIFIIPIIINFVLSGNLIYLFGYGSFRIFLMYSSFFLTLCLYKFKEIEIIYFIIIIIFISFINSIYSILIFLKFLPQLFNYNVRLGYTRISGFSYSPAYIGAILSTSLALILPYLTKISFTKIIVFFTILIGLFLSMNRTGIISLLIILSFYIYIIGNNKIKFLSFIFLIFSIFIAYKFMGGVNIKSFDIPYNLQEDAFLDRWKLLLSSVYIFLHNPLGIPWGNFILYDKLNSVAGEPHNLFALILIYGGIVSIISFLIFLYKILKNSFINFNELPITIKSITLGSLSLLIYSQLEITLYHVFVMLPLLLFLVLIASYNNKKLIYQLP